MIFHRVLPVHDPLNPGEPDAHQFEALLSLVRDCCNVIPLAEAAARLHGGGLPARAASITFDDGYADNATIAVPLLQKLGLPATFFIAAGFLDGGRMFNDTVIETVRRHAGDVLDLADLGLGVYRTGDSAQRCAAIDALLGRLKFLEPRRRSETAAAIAGRSPEPLPDDLMMTTAQVRALHRAGMAVGAHTVNHPILTRVGEAEARKEIMQGKAMIEGITGERVSLFAYPNGRPLRDYDASHVAMVRGAGFACAVSTAIGAASSAADLFQLPRFTPWSRHAMKAGAQLVQNLFRTRYPLA